MVKASVARFAIGNIAFACSCLGLTADEPPGNCGAMCLYSVACAMDLESSTYFEFLETRQWAKQEECSLQDLANGADSYRLTHELIEYSPPEIPEYEGVLIAHTNANHFVLIVRDAPGAVLWCDPPELPKVATNDSLAQLSGAGLVIGKRNGSRWHRILAVCIGSLALCALGYVLFRRLRNA